MNPIVYIKLAAAFALSALIGLAFWKTYDAGYDKAAAIGAENLANYKLKVSQAAASAASGAFADYASHVTRGQAAESQFFIDQHAADTHSAALKEHIDEVAQPHATLRPRAINVQSAAPVPSVRECVFSWGFVRLWNAAAGIDDGGGAMPTGADPSRATGSSSAIATADSGVSQADILDWFVDYANRAHSTEAKLTAIRSLQPASQTAATTAQQ
jgi:hypothetical protein